MSSHHASPRREKQGRADERAPRTDSETNASEGHSPISRRQFVAGASSLVLAGTAAQGVVADADATDSSRLALHGGKKATEGAPALPIRWGQPERERLDAMLHCAQAWGARYRGKPVGTVGHFACFSLQNSKLITCGDGGAVGSNDPQFGPLLQKFGDKGYDRIKGGGFQAFATNYRMSEPQAAVAAAQLGRLEHIAATRSRFGNLLTEKIAGVTGIAPHDVHPEDRAVYWFYMFRLKPDAFRCDRAEFVRALRTEGVAASAGYIGVPLYGEPVFQEHGFFAGRWPVREFGLTKMDYTKHHCPEAEAILKTGVRIVIHQAMTEDYIQGVATAVKKVARYYAV